MRSKDKILRGMQASIPVTTLLKYCLFAAFMNSLTKPFGQEASNPSTAADSLTVDLQNRKVAQGCT